ncbi:uncharacterized protein LOC113511863 isoform X2 [Galleria mellonella]|uniref:Uncharacterized protein LOC113511863 isoform X2 n=1 Tax=Galleria mellonella TaxID=7137 RepID=A0A6J3CEG2_GALME|nr:uncharacterized protein LOC113511863 isoform X2 [Galleria mellonella]
MYNKKLCVAVVVFLSFQECTEGRKSRRNQRPKPEENTTLQPSVVSYSTFGFNDVGSYDGFVPSSPDYANYLTNINQETSTRLYAPAFPTALDNIDTSSGSNYDSQSDGQYFTSPDLGGIQSSIVEYPKHMNFYSTPSFDSDNQNKNIFSKDTFERDTVENNAPVYGTKLGSKSKKMLNRFNETEFDVYNSGVINPSDMSSNFNFPHGQGIFEDKPSFGESANNYQITPSHVGARPIYQSVNIEDIVKPESSNSHSSLKFPKVIDFTKINYPTSVENKYNFASFNSMKNIDMKKEHEYKHDDQINKFKNNASTLKDPLTFTRNYEKSAEKQLSKPYLNQEYSQNYISSSPMKTNFKDMNLDPRDKIKYSMNNYSNEDKTLNPHKGYEYSTNYSNTSFKYEYVEPKKPFTSHSDEVVPASSNVIDLAHYQFPEVDYTSFKKIPDIKSSYDDDDYSNILLNKNKVKSTEYLNSFKNMHGSTPSSTTNWGNIFKSTDYSFSKNHLRKPIHSDDITSDVVHIPKKPHSTKYNNGKDIDYTSSDLSNSKIRTYNSKIKLGNDWNSDVYNHRYKTEEDLLGLRNHDTSHPSYLPTYRPSANDLSDDKEYYKKLVEKWRQSYWKSKFKNSYPDYESYSTEAKPVHVPIPKPYPVTVPVMQPYPVHIPHVRPVFHHTRPREEFESDIPIDDDDDYFPRPEGSKKQNSYKKRPRSTRTKIHRPTRTAYSTYKKRPRRPADFRTRRPSSTHVDFHYSVPHRHSDFDQEQFDETSDYFSYCKRTGNC